MPTRDRTTRQLCQRIRRGDEQSVREFFTDWFPNLVSWSGAFVPSDEHLALDIVQETMIRVIRSLPALDSHAALVAWLRAANRSAAIDLIRRRLVSQARERAVAKSESSGPCTLSAATTPGTLPEYNTLTRAIAELSPDDQLLLRLRADSSASFDQLTPSLGGTADSLYGRARRALARLRRLLSEEGADA